MVRNLLKLVGMSMNAKKLTLTETIAKELVHAIVTGKWATGSLMPTEAELVRRFACSRVTIRRALDVLEKDGMIERRPGIGTRVISKGQGVGFSYSLSSVDDLDQLASDHRRKILVAVPITADKQLAARIGCLIGTKLYRLSNLRQGEREGDPPIVFTYVYFSSRFPQVVDNAKAHPEILAVHLVEAAAKRLCVEVRQKIEAVALPEEFSTLLAAETGSPALKITRRYLDAEGKFLLISESWHPGHRYAFSLTAKQDRKIAG